MSGWATLKVFNGICADDVERFQLSDRGCFHHLARCQTRGRGQFDAAPNLSKAGAFGCVADVRVTRQTIGQHAHVRCAARVRVIAESHEAGLAAEARGERNQVANRSALNVRAEENQDVLFSFQRSFQLNERFGGWRIELAFFVSEPAQRGAFSAFRELHDLGRFAVNFAFLAVDDVQAGAVMPHAGANLPGDQRILIGDVVADQQNGLRGVNVAHRGQ